MKWPLYITVYFLLKCGMSFCQKQADYWYFGNKAGLNFATNPPTILTDGVLIAQEGCSTISDVSGNLLFYTNCNTVWNKNHQIMDNGTGLFGSQNATQAALIVKKPASSSLYYIFTLDAYGQPGGGTLSYSIVDMSLAAGLGSVTVKNATLQTNLVEKMAGTQHCNGTDVWVMVHETNSTVFHAFLITSSGISVNTSTSSVGTIHATGATFQGQLKFSSNGKKLGLVTPGFAEIFDFDNTNGIVSNHLALGNYPGYGCEFSGDGTKFYTTYYDSIVYLSQWDLCAGTNSAIILSQYSIMSQYNAFYQMQLSNNGKIYVTSNLNQSLGVINDPNQAGAVCSYSAYAQSVAPNSLEFGLPNFVSGFYKSPIPAFSQIQSSLSCQSLSFSPQASYLCQQTTYPGLTFQWNFGDPASGAGNNISNQTNPVHNFSSAGTYTVVLTYLYPCYSQTVASTVQVKKQPQVKINGLLSATINVCNGTTITLTATGAESYSWSTGALSPSINTTSTSTGFTITGIDTSTNCKSTRTVQVKYISCTGIEKNIVTTSVFSIYPNPGKGIYNFETEKSCKIEVRNILGATVYKCDIAEGIHALNLESLADGVYFFCVLVDDKWQIQKLIKDSKN